MEKIYQITLSEAQNKAMEHIAKDVQDWIENAVYQRANTSINDICQRYVSYKLEKNEPITVVTKDEMVLAAFNEGVVKTGIETYEESLASLEKITQK